MVVRAGEAGSVVVPDRVVDAVMGLIIAGWPGSNEGVAREDLRRLATDIVAEIGVGALIDEQLLPVAGMGGRGMMVGQVRSEPGTAPWVVVGPRRWMDLP